MNKTIYLAGNISFNNYKAVTQWLNEATELLERYNWTVLNPIASEPIDKNEQSIAMRHDDNYALSDQAITGKDYFYIQQSSVVLANFLVCAPNYPMIGTTLEIGYATALHKLIYVVAPKESLWANHPMITSRCVVLPNIKLALDIITKL